MTHGIGKTGKKAKVVMTDKGIYLGLMEAKRLIDTIIEQKGLESDHPLHIASDNLNDVLDSLEEQLELMEET